MHRSDTIVFQKRNPGRLSQTANHIGKGRILCIPSSSGYNHATREFYRLLQSMRQFVRLHILFGTLSCRRNSLTGGIRRLSARVENTSRATSSTEILSIIRSQKCGLLARDPANVIDRVMSSFDRLGNLLCKIFFSQETACTASRRLIGASLLRDMHAGFFVPIPPARATKQPDGKPPR